jgi:prepilin-type N-terminal cleavage/methylation domain-containing protein
MRRSGFTLIEIILVLGVVGVVAGVSVPIYRDYQIKSDLNLATEQVAQGIERARLLAQSGTEDDAWGFFVPAGVLYKGASYEHRDPAFDEVYPMPSTIRITGLFEVNYSAVDGRPSETGLIRLSTLNNYDRSIEIDVNPQLVAITTPDPITICADGVTRVVQESEAVGFSSVSHGPCEEGEVSEGGASSSPVVVVEGGGGTVSPCGEGKIQICHVPPGNPTNRRTLCVGAPSWPAHRANGSTLGACAVEIDDSVPAPVCQDRFFLDEDWNIITQGRLDVTVRVLGTSLTFGNGGPEVGVRVESSDDGGAKWKKLFQGKNIVAGNSDSVKNMRTDDRLALRVQGYYKEDKWLSFKESFSTNIRDGHIAILRNGSPFPSYPAFAPHQSVVPYLEPYRGPDGTAVLGPYQVLVLAELGSLDLASADFQDAVLLLEFGAPSCS